MNSVEHIFDTAKEIRAFFTSSKIHLLWGLIVTNEEGFFAIVEQERTIHILVWMDTKNGYVVFETYPGIHCEQPYRRQTLDFGTAAISKSGVGIFWLKDNGTVYITSKISFHNAPVTHQQLFKLEKDLLDFISKYAEDIEHVAHYSGSGEPDEQPMDASSIIKETPTKIEIRGRDENNEK